MDKTQTGIPHAYHSIGITYIDPPYLSRLSRKRYQYRSMSVETESTMHYISKWAMLETLLLILQSIHSIRYLKADMVFVIYLCISR